MNFKRNCGMIAIICFILAWTAAVSIAETTAAYSSDWVVLLFLVGVINALIGYIYVSGQRRIERDNRDFKDALSVINSRVERDNNAFKNTIKDLHRDLRSDIKDLYERKLDIEHHKEICFRWGKEDEKA